VDLSFGAEEEGSVLRSRGGRFCSPELRREVLRSKVHFFGAGMEQDGTGVPLSPGLVLH